MNLLYLEPLQKIKLGLILSLIFITACNKNQHQDDGLNYKLPPIPDIEHLAEENSISLEGADTFKEVNIDIPITKGPYKPTWQSIENNYPGTPQWLRDAKLGIWVHFGPQSAGQSGDWYARRLYTEGTEAYKNHLTHYGHPSKIGYKDVLNSWNPKKLDPKSLVETYKEAGIKFLIIQGVHHDQFDMWDSKYQPWNATNIGPKRDLLGEWEKAAREADMRFGITFHHEYSWWWWQTAFQSDTKGPKKGVPYDGNLTLKDGKGTWWEGYDPRLLYGVNLREYKGVADAANSRWSPPPAGIFKNHLPYSTWYSQWWAARMMDAVDKYQPDFIYTDGTDQQPFSGFGTGTGFKSNAMQHVIADFYNKTLQRRGEVDVFSIVKFRDKTNGTVNTQEGGIPEDIKTDQDWIAETPVGDWFYGPDFTYSADAVIRYLLEEVARDGNVGICVSLLPDGSLDQGSTQMLKDIGTWMRINGQGIYGSAAWKVLGEGANERLNVLPGGKIGKRQAEHQFSTQDIRFTKGKDGHVYAWVMTVPQPGETLQFKSLGLNKNNAKIKTITLLGHQGQLQWNQSADFLTITCPQKMAFNTAVGFKIEFK
ncbi:alpha-L-fucosidase [Leeuwenhoekiella sp. UBA6783]|uniref:alpha-L-fucosidase n=1 Tax=Leeuwenhoekiella sp. UBA6783 TaxID=1946747 RepID=UPI0025BC957E|nr:alpha-L-fucosidase [Leeuwenhoekiella sp. UBA6783]|tara:strand:- start:2191 stop:3972 length:1782 start_codon:yes stop_codon:yes gene_type:complete